MLSETHSTSSGQARQCQNCKNQFTIEPEDFAFYEKIKVPPPTWCPECRFQRRLAFTNLFHLYRRKCDLCMRDIISMYPAGINYKVYCSACWYSDNWDPQEYGRDYDFSRPFLEQYNELLHDVPLMALSLDLASAVDSPHNNYAGHLKNAYLLFFADFIENCGYGFYIQGSKDVYDSSVLSLCESSYDLRNAYKDHRCIGLENSIESLDCTFLRDSQNCQNCFGSANLRNKKYYIFNEPHTPESYREEMKKWDLGSYRIYQEARKKARESWKNHPPQPRWDTLSTNVSGNYVFESKNCHECYEVTGAEDSRYLFMMFDAPTRDSWDVSGWGNNVERCYESSIIGEGAAGVRFTHDSGIGLQDAEYCKLSLGGSAHLFGCVSMRNKSYCILNKQYTPEEFSKLRTRIIEHMDEVPYRDKRGRVYGYGEFFPTEICPSPYNETIAQNFFPLSKEEIESNGYGYRDLDNIDKASGATPAFELPDHVRDTGEDILQKILGCIECGKGYRIIPRELEFLKRMNIALPRACPFCRIKEKFQAWVKLMGKLVVRVCSRCGDEFKTPYSEEDYPTIWCSKCYREEVQ